MEKPKSKSRKLWRKGLYLVAVFALCALAFMVFVRRNTNEEVTVFKPRVEVANSVLIVSGELEALEDASISSTLSISRIAEVMVRKGSTVKIGDSLIRLDAPEVLANRNHALAALQGAKSNLEKSRISLDGTGRNLIISERDYWEAVELTASRDSAKTQFEVAQKKVRQAELTLVRTQEGSRPEDIRVAQANLFSAEAQFQQKKKEAEREKYLSDAGALAKSKYDDIYTQYLVAQSAMESARMQLEIAKRPRREDLATAESGMAEANSNLRGARVALDNAKRALDLRTTQRTNLSNATTTKNAAEMELQVQDSAVRQAESDLEQAEDQVRKTLLRSPINGEVIDILAKEGESAPPGQALLKLSTTQKFRARANVEEKFIPMLAVGQKVILTFESIPNLQLAAKVSEIIGNTDTASGTVPILFTLLGTDARLRSGMTLDVNIQTTSKRPVRLIPPSSIVREGSEAYVFAVRGGKAKRLGVKLGRQTDKGFVVLSGVDENDLVVTEGTAMRDGTSVKAKTSP